MTRKGQSSLDEPGRELQKRRTRPHNSSAAELMRDGESTPIEAGILTQSSVLHTLTHSAPARPQLNKQTRVHTVPLTTSLVWIMA